MTEATPETTPEVEVTEARPEVTAMSGNADPNEGNTEYLVRLLFRLSAKDPAEAVKKYQEQLIDYGIRNWSFRVEDEETGEMWHLDGHGVEIENGHVPPEDD